MLAFVFTAAIACFDFDGLIAPWSEIIRCSAHVDLTGFDREEEGFAEEVGGNPRGAFVSPLVEVHVGVETAGLLVFLTS